MGAGALAAGTVQCAATGRALVAAAAVRSAPSSPLLPLRVVSDQATANRDRRWPHAQAESTQHTTRWSRKVGHSGVAARTRLGRERGGSLLHLAQLQNHNNPQPCRNRPAAEERRPLDRHRSGSRGACRASRRPERGEQCRGALRLNQPTTTQRGRSWAEAAHASRWLGAGLAAQEQRARADGSALARWRQQGGGTGCDNKQRQRPRAGLAAAGAAAAAASHISPRAGRRRLA